MVTIVLPTHNEAAIIRVNLDRVLAYLRQEIREPWEVIVSDNGSTDATRDIVREVAAREPHIQLLAIPETGKGRAVLTAWTHAVRQLSAIGYRPAPARASGLSAFVFMDADLATDLKHLPELIAAIRSGADIAVGSRYAPRSSTQRGAFRRLTSQCYRTLLRMRFGLTITDPPCGFKAVNARAVQDIVPLVRDTKWFFDTELLVRAERAGLRIAEVPITWREPRRGRSFAKVLRIILHDLHAMQKLHRELFNTRC
ncbi:glycosyltransferase [Candidatus Uhrbacteria bacterium]|nr:glycosyltransferase [Candidatus Uhrbacteria bacterium]